MEEEWLMQGQNWLNAYEAGTLWNGVQRLYSGLPPSYPYSNDPDLYWHGVPPSPEDWWW